MSKIFAKIRRRLLTENRLTRYLIYAIGEIVLVVLGILIALQINDYNQSLEDRRQEQIMLTRFANDLRADSADIASVMGRSTRNMQDMKDLLRGLSSRSITSDDFYLKTRTLLARDYFEKIRGTYSEVLANGKMDLMQNQELRDALMAYYDREDFGADRQMRDVMVSTIYPIGFPAVAHSNELAEGLVGEKLAFETLDMEAISSNTSYRAILLAKLMMFQAQERQWRAQDTRITSLIKQVDVELKARWGD